MPTGGDATIWGCDETERCRSSWPSARRWPCWGSSRCSTRVVRRVGERDLGERRRRPRARRRRRRRPPRPRLAMPSSAAPMALTRTVTGDISPKSVVASERGLVFAQNMMYRHTITVYDRNGDLVKTIPDTVNLADFGIPDHPGLVQGAPVEAAFSPGRQVRVRVQLLDVRRGLRPRGRRQLRPGRRLRLELRLPDQRREPGRRPGDRGRLGAEVRGGDPRQPLPARHQLVHLRPERRRHRDRQGGQAHRAWVRTRAASS